MMPVLSHSYKSFLVLDQLRRRAGISVPQLLGVIDLDISNYSRVSAKVYAKHEGVLHYGLEQTIRHGVDVLTAAYTQNLVSPTTLKQPRSIVGVLQQVSKQLKHEEPADLVDCDITLLLSEASIILIT